MAKDEKRGTVAQLLDFAGERRGLTIVGCALSAVAMAINMVPYVCVWLLVRDLVSVAPNWAQATGIAAFGWAAFGFAVAASWCTSVRSCARTWPRSARRPTFASAAWST